MKKKVKLITETLYDLEVSESSKDKSLYLVGIFSSAEIQNGNGRKYPKEILEREVKKLVDEKVKNRCAYGELEHPEKASISLENAAVLTESLEWRGSDVYGRCKVLSTPKGQILKAIIQDGGRVGISSRGLGTVSESGVVNEDYNMICYDVVSMPSNHPSWMKGIYEAKDFEIDIDEVPEEVTEISLDEAKKVYFKQVMNVLNELETSSMLEFNFLTEENFNEIKYLNESDRLDEFNPFNNPRGQFYQMLEKGIFSVKDGKAYWKDGTEVFIMDKSGKKVLSSELIKGKSGFKKAVSRLNPKTKTGKENLKRLAAATSGGAIGGALGGYLAGGASPLGIGGGAVLGAAHAGIKQLYKTVKG